METVFETRTKIVGVTRGNGQELLEELSEMDDIRLVREPDNPHDVNAIAVLNPNGEKLGYIRSGLAKELASYMQLYPDAILIGEILEITGDEVGKNYGCNIEISLMNPDDRALITHQVNITARYATIFWVIGFITLMLSLPAFDLAWPIGVFFLLISAVLIAIGAYFLKLSSTLEKSIYGQITQNPREKRKISKVKILIWIFALTGISLIIYGVVSILN